jgi:internalin A
VWRNGVVLRWTDAQAEVSKTKSQGRDAFWVRVQGHNRRSMLTSIVQSFRALHGEYKGIKAFEMVPCPCSGCKSGQNRQHYFDFESLSNRLSKGRSTIECDKSLEVLDVQGFLENRFVFDQSKSGEPLRLRVETGRFDTGASNTKTGVTQPKALRAFFSYSKHDIAHLQDFQKYLKPLERQGLIEFWDDRHIRPGEEWDGEIKEALIQSDIIFLLVTADFIDTDYVWNIEIKEAMRRHKAKTACVVPIRVSSCDWAGMPFAELQGIPRKDQIIDLAPNKAAVWTEVVKEVKSILMAR